MAHDGPLAAGTRHRYPTPPPVPDRLERAGVQSSGRATNDVVGAVVAPERSGLGVPGRRTITITGYAAQRPVSQYAAERPVSPYAAERPVSHSRPELRRPFVPRHQRGGFRPDRYAALAVALALLLVFVAATSAHGATLHAAAPAHVARMHAAAGAPALRAGRIHRLR